MKPPWLMMPLALANRSGGLEVRPTSNPIIEAGPPTPTTSTSTTSSGVGAWPGHARTAVHVTTMAETMVRTIVDRCHGWLPTSQPSTGPAAITASTISVSSTPAVASDWCSPLTKNG